MTVSDILHGAPGSRTFVICGRKEQESMVEAVCVAVPDSLREKAALNFCCITLMDMASDKQPNRFSDLQNLCVKLIYAAGKRSHFEGILFLNVSAPAKAKDRGMRMKALGELLAMKEGLASRCTTILYGPSEERSMILCTEQLDFDRTLRVGRYEPVPHPSLDEVLNQASLRCESSEAEAMLSSAINCMAQCSGFRAERFVLACSDGQGVITERAVSEALQDPYPYINRIKKAAEFKGGKLCLRKLYN